MNRRIISLLGIAVVAAVLLTSAGCKRQTPSSTEPGRGQPHQAETTPSVVTTPTNQPQTDSVSSGPVSTPAAGTAVRTALMDAARTRLSTTSQFVVNQLYVQGDAAIGDIETVSGGKRYFVAWRGPEWVAVWSEPFGSSGASLAAATTALPTFSSALLDKVDWKFAKPASAAQLKASLAKSAQGWADSMMGGVGKPYKVETAKVAKDSKGNWWGLAVVQPSPSEGNSYEALVFWCRYENGAWSGQAQDPEPPAPSTYFPSEVVGVLGL